MASPTVRGRTAPAAGLSATSPAGTAVGDMVICLTWETRANATPPTHTLQANFVEIIQNGDYTETGQSGRLSVAYKIAIASGANSYQAYTSSDGTTTRTAIIVITVATFAATATNKGPSASAKVASTSNGAPDPPLVTLDAARDWLVIAVGGWCFSSSTASTATVMSNYTNLQQFTTSGLGAIATAERALTAAASENPATYTDNSTPTGSAAVTIGIGSPIVFTRTLAVDGAGGIATAATFFTTFERSAAIDGAGSIATSANFFTTFERSLGIGATVSISSSGEIGPSFNVFERAASLNAGGAIAVAGQRDLLRSTSIGAAAGIASDGFGILQRSSVVNASASVSITAQTEQMRSALLSASAGIQVSGVVVPIGPAVHERSVSIGGTCWVEVDPEFFSVFERTCSIGGTGTITVAGEMPAEIIVIQGPSRISLANSGRLGVRISSGTSTGLASSGQSSSSAGSSESSTTIQ